MNDRAAHSISMLRHSAAYLLARGLPGVIAFLAIPIYTRLLRPDEYGRYVLVLAYAVLCNALIFNWIRVSLLRYLPAFHDRERELRATLFALNVVLSLAVVLLSALLFVLGGEQPWRELVLPACILIICHATFELFLEHERARLRPWLYSRQLLTKTVLSVGTGALFVWLGWSWWGPVLGLTVGMLVPAAWTYVRDWASVGFAWDTKIIGTAARFGIPVSATVAFAALMIGADRFLIAWFLGEGSAGQYAAGADLTAQSLTLLMMVVNLAGYPLAVREWERAGPEAAKVQLKQNASLLVAIALPAAAGLVVLAPGISSLVLGEQYRVAAARVIPIIAIGALLAGLKAFYFDQAFQFAERTLTQVWIVMVAATTNVLLNLVLIPRYGIAGAAVASASAHTLSLGTTIIVGRRYLALPFPGLVFVKAVMATGVMVMVILLLPELPHPWDTMVRTVVGAGTYGSVMFILNLRHGLRGGVGAGTERRIQS